MSKDEALKMAIEVIEAFDDDYFMDVSNVLDVCKEALEQPTQEPIAHIKQGGTGYPVLIFNGRFQYASLTAKQPDIPLYTHPKEWISLSDDDISYTWAGFAPDAIDFARAIEAKLKELNTK